jgi:hypothetical protein
MADEVELFGFYLRTRLHPKTISDIMSCEPHGILITDFQTRFDEWFEWRLGLNTQEPTIRVDVPVPMHQVLRGCPEISLGTTVDLLDS